MVSESIKFPIGHKIMGCKGTWCLQSQLNCLCFICSEVQYFMHFGQSYAKAIFVMSNDYFPWFKFRKLPMLCMGRFCAGPCEAYKKELELLTTHPQEKNRHWQHDKRGVRKDRIPLFSLFPLFPWCLNSATLLIASGTLWPKSPRMRFLLFNLAFCHILTDMSV